jgi:phosphoribosylglycinamide formyltransferase-1
MLLSKPLRLAFMASHGGSSMRAIVAAIRAGELDAEPRLLISNNAGCEALVFAQQENIPSRQISAAGSGSPEAADRAIAEALEASGAELIILSGYMRKLAQFTLDRWRGRILNIHPSLLPRYGGQGMYGRRVHEAVKASGDAVSGASIHLVEDDYDTGPVVARREVPVNPGDSVEDIENRVRAAEPGLYVETLQRIAGGLLQLPS